GPQACVLRGAALAGMPELIAGLAEVLARAPFRQMVTPGGQTMSVALTNCGALGWTSDRRGYRYTPLDPLSGEPWPAMPPAFLQHAGAWARQAGFDGFQPDACLINRYLPGTRLSLHQDRNERDLGAPIVSASLGAPAVFLFGGPARSDRPEKVLLEHGDVAVWGGVDRLRFHGVMPLKEAPDHLFQSMPHPLLQGQRVNLTLRKAG
ncbi:MAG: DNA oxidative demethylase AlkB, partial [Lautropia sp.]|nr:DNA oxidative demethylase AlkB [Lautropia sp.]